MIRNLSKGRGVAESVMALYRNIDRAKIQFDFVTHTKYFNCDMVDEIQSMGGQVYFVPDSARKNRSKYKTYWNNFLQQHSEFKIVHAHTNGSVHDTAPVFLTVVKEHGLFTILHSRNTGVGFGKNQRFIWKIRHSIKNLALNLLRLKTADNFDYYFACSNAAGECVFGKKIIKQPNFCVVFSARNVEKYAFDAEVRKKVRLEFGIDNKTFVIGHVGRFEKQKNHSFLINIFKKLHDKNPNTILLLVGNDSAILGGSIKNQVKSLNLNENVLFTGVRGDVNHLMQGMDVFVLPSLFEGLPGTAIEAQSAGLKCFLSDTITSETKVTELIKFISLNDSAQIWADHILNCINCGYVRKDMTEQVRSAGFDIRQSAKWLQDFYEDKLC